MTIAAIQPTSPPAVPLGATLEYLQQALMVLRTRHAVDGGLPQSVALWLPDDIDAPEFAAFMHYDAIQVAVFEQNIRALRALLKSLGVAVRFDRRTSAEMAMTLDEAGISPAFDGSFDLAIIHKEIAERSATPEYPWEAVRLSSDVDAFAAHITDILDNETPALHPALERALERYDAAAEERLREERVARLEHALKPTAIAMIKGRLLRREPLTAEDEELYRALFKDAFGFAH